MQVLFCREAVGRSVLDCVVVGDERHRGREGRGGEPFTLALRHPSERQADLDIASMVEQFHRWAADTSIVQADLVAMDDGTNYLLIVSGSDQVVIEVQPLLGEL